MNFVYFNPAYDSLACLPNWAQKSLDEHKKDAREFLYSKDALENGQTHDMYWNAAMREMKISGFMHNYMRMYWGKKILEWSETPEKAYETLTAINNKYFLDGRDPNSYAGIGWIFGLHDRAWFERPVFGKVRYMTASGLERKCDIKGYVSRINQMI
jgi:deoxyribodipyrimidine photo-lyase